MHFEIHVMVFSGTTKQSMHHKWVACREILLSS